ncbi:MAG: serine/threonine-protein phosphatase, partial [Candidatus Cloacimonetes bacterium]|nr:serine/threonine-protein phosphatase [Candidatus Cloacimonadota bacterium]
VLIRSGAYQTLFSAAFFPPDFNESQYLRNLAEPPYGMVITLADRLMIGRQFAELINIESSENTSYSELIHRYNQKAKPHIPMYAGDEVLAEIKNLQHLLLQKKHGSNFQQSSALISLMYQFCEFFGIFDEFKAKNKASLEAYWRKNTRIYLLPNEDAQQWLSEQNENNSGWLVSILPSHAPMLPGFVYVTRLPESVAYRDLFLFLVVSICLAFLGAMTALFLGQSMSHNMVIPLMNLQKKVLAYTNGETPSVLEKGTKGDEIQVMENDFLDMVLTINQRLTQTSFLNEMNRRTTDGEDSSSVLQDLLAQMIHICKASNASMRFMERNNPAVTIAEVHTPEFVALKSYQQIALDNPFSIPDLPLDSDLIGFVNLYPESAWPPDEKDLEFFQSLASLALAIQGKAWLDKLKKDNVEGQEIQLSLMPSQSLDTNGNLELASSYVAARFLGGDFFDWFLCPDGPVLVISDVSGKGVGAALFGASCKATLRQLMAGSSECGENLGRLNELLCIDKQNSLFASLFLARIDSKNQKLYFASAGHNKMILIRQGKTIEFLNAKGLPLGMFTPVVYETKVVPFSPGDILCLYTDGVNELEDPMLNLYGIPRLESLLLKNSHLSMAELKQCLLQDLEDYREMRPPSDDITFILAKSVVPG